MSNTRENDGTSDHFDTVVRSIPAGALDTIAEDAVRAGGEWEEPAEFAGSVGRTMFDSPTSKVDSIIVLLPREHLQDLPSQALVRIPSYPDGHEYLGVVVEGPFADPDGLRADAPLVVTTTVRGGIFMPRFHGRVGVALLGERVDGVLQPPRYRPLPNSPVFRLGAEETAQVLNVQGDLRLGLAVGHDDLPVAVPSSSKAVLPRHTGIIGTTGGGKSTTVAGFIAQAQCAGIATILLDVEGEYTELAEPTDDAKMATLLRRHDREPKGVENVALFHLVGREPSNPDYERQTEFALQFGRLSPYLVTEILDLPDAQITRYWHAYELTKSLLRRFGVANTDEFDLDEFEAGYPDMTLQHLLDVVGGFVARLNQNEAMPRSPEFKFQVDEFRKELAKAQLKSDSLASWQSLIGKLGRLRRLNVFDQPKADSIEFSELTRPGQVSVIDLSDTDSPYLRNLVIADILRGVQRQQEDEYNLARTNGTEPPRTLVIVEEAHEFLSRERIAQMPVLFQQIARIAKRGRKRWLGLVFVSQLPQHLPNEVISLVNNWIIHKLADAGVIATLRHSIGGIDDSQWKRLPSLAPGQAVVSFGQMPRPLLISIDPAAAKLRMVE